MSNLEIGLYSFPILLILIFLRVPIGLAMFSTGFVGLSIVTGAPDIPLAKDEIRSVHDVFKLFAFDCADVLAYGTFCDTWRNEPGVV